MLIFWTFQTLRVCFYINNGVAINKRFHSRRKLTISACYTLKSVLCSSRPIIAISQEEEAKTQPTLMNRQQLTLVLSGHDKQWNRVTVWQELVIFYTLGNLSKPLATINLPNSLTFLVNIWKGVIIINFISEIVFGHLL